MQMMKRTVWLLLTVAMAAVPAWAGRSCEERPINPQIAQKATELALQAREKLENSGASLALIGRAGQNLSRYGVRYSHFGFVWRDHPKGKWRVVHQLNECGTDRSEIYDEGLANFFMDDLWRMEAVILIPNAQTQERLAGLLAARKHLDFHNAHYSMVAYPYSTRYQNSNQWALEIIAAAGSRDIPVTNREQAQQWLKLAGYQPTELKLDTLTRLGARMTKANVAFDDHPGELRWSDRIRTVTVDSVFSFVQTREPDAKRMVVAQR
ncbi:MAG: DUF2145 domain-containing protein [Betaproteobacteria bacterium]|nr:DUF2145 domain-containing protein [Betaproteobacteria bacterium]